jgi:hypothetical protein
MKLFNDKKKSIDLTYNINIDLVKTYNHIINCNFFTEEIELLFYYYFNDNLSYKSFQRFRNILLKPIDNILEYFVKSNYFNLKINNQIKSNFYENILIDNENNYKMKYIDKYVFTSHQYHILLDYRLNIMNMLDEALEKIKLNLLDTCDKLYNSINEKSIKYKYIFKILELIKNNNFTRQNIIALKEKYKINYLDKLDKKSFISKIIYLNYNVELDEKKHREFYELCKDEYDEFKKKLINININNYLLDKFNKFNKFNENNILNLFLKKKISNDLLEKSSLIKKRVIDNLFDSKENIIKNISTKFFKIEDIIDDDNLSEDNLEESIKNLDLKTHLYLSKNKEELILEMICILIENLNKDDNEIKKKS